ncbi:cytokinin riboside 5'-monophosphate phosphoribohydrolase [Bacteroidia bacterium]|nr:cytokinin riboside 5'-monophosphate phosphoribohydrolase [Bacteroidia bacterium]GHT45256.1 cytokinin riboside 5'-monophosphate phosphoribohydrolase [Bacteroidia bacterium]
MTVTVYAASSTQVAPVYIRAAQNLGKLLAQNHISCINGAGKTGLMAAVTDAVLENGGQVIGIIPQFMVTNGWCHDALSERIITPDMHTRKQLMAQRSDACIALPGGIGTLEELLEIITWKQLNLYHQPVVILNTAHYYDDLLQMLEKTKQEHFLHHEGLSLWSVAETPEEALEKIRL